MPKTYTGISTSRQRQGLSSIFGDYGKIPETIRKFLVNTSGLKQEMIFVEERGHWSSSNEPHGRIPCHLGFLSQRTLVLAPPEVL